MKTRRPALLLSFFFITSSCQTVEFGLKVIDINGMVYDFSNRPVAYCDISIGDEYKSITDINGRFTLPKVPAGIYTITGSKKGFESYSDEIDIKDWGQIIYIRMPSQNQLLNLADEALTLNNLEAALEFVERAYYIDENNIEMLFYFATVCFRLREYDKAAGFLVKAQNLGSRDAYIDRFLSIIKELQYEERDGERD